METNKSVQSAILLPKNAFNERTLIVDVAHVRKPVRDQHANSAHIVYFNSKHHNKKNL